MTLIAGFLFKNTAGLIADSAVTGIVSLPPQANLSDPQIKSVLGDTPYYDGVRLTVESCNKIYAIDENILVTFSGIETEGKAAVKDLSLFLKLESSPSNMLMKYFDSNKFENTEYIVAFNERGVSKLFFKYINTKPEIIDHSNAVVVGGTNAKGIWVSIQKNLENSIEKDFTPHQNLQLMLGVLQGTSLHLRTLEDGVGGLFNGALVTVDGIEWAKDTFFMLYSSRAFDKGNKYVAFRCNRDRMVFAANEIKRKIFYSDIEGNPSQDQIQKLSKEIDNIDSTLSYDFFIMISYDRKNITIVDNNPDKKERIIVNNGQLEINGLIKKYMFQYYSEVPSGEQLGFEVYTNFLS